MSKISEANIAARLKDPPRKPDGTPSGPSPAKMIKLAILHDWSFPPIILAKIGPSGKPEEYLEAWSQLLDYKLENAAYGNIAQGQKFDKLVTDIYMKGFVGFEDLSARIIDPLSGLFALLNNNKLKPEHRNFTELHPTMLADIINTPEYSDFLIKTKLKAEISKHKKESKQHILIDNDRFLVFLPFNYGSCFTFNYMGDIIANYCTGSSNGLGYFNSYSRETYIICIFDKQNEKYGPIRNDPNYKYDAKFQLCVGGTYQEIKNARQESGYSTDTHFAKIFPGLLKKIIRELGSQKESILQAAKEAGFRDKGIDRLIQDLKIKMPRSYETEEPKEKEKKEATPEEQPNLQAAPEGLPPPPQVPPPPPPPIPPQQQAPNIPPPPELP